MTQPRIENIRLVRAKDWGAEFTFDVPVASLAAMVFAIRDTWATTQTSDSDALFSADLTPTGEKTARVDVPHAIAAGLQGERYVYDVHVTMPSGKVYQAQRGSVAMDPDVGR